VELVGRIDGRRHDAFEAAANLRFKRRSHGVRGFADGDHKNAVVGVEVVEIVANTQHAAVAVNMPSERAFDGGVLERRKKYRGLFRACARPGVSGPGQSPA